MGIGANTRKAWERRTGQELGYAREDRVNRARRLGASEPNYSWGERGRARTHSAEDRIAAYWAMVDAGVLVYSRYPRLAGVG